MKMMGGRAAAAAAGGDDSDDENSVGVVIRVGESQGTLRSGYSD